MAKEKIRIAVLSGKGGTGKTLISTNLAALVENSLYIDCDIEEPNGHLFFKPQDIKEEEINVQVPLVDKSLCDACRKCVDFCRFNALAYVGDGLKIFEDICHSCGGCVFVCPKKALTEKDKPIGKIQRGKSENVLVHTGILNIGEPSGVPIIDKLLKTEGIDHSACFIDCPPGTACTAMESIKDADYCILVAEPTIFGLHNLDMVHELVKVFKKPFSVIINKSYNEISLIDDYCQENKIKVLAKIPFDEKLGLLNSKAKIAVRESEKFKKSFGKILEELLKEVDHERNINP